MTMVTPNRLIAALCYTPAILEALLHDVDAETARSATDGPDGWSVVQIVCHLRDLEKVFFGRAQQALAEDNPTLTPLDHEALLRDGDYQNQNLRQALADLRETRRNFVHWLKALSADQWKRAAQHPELGAITILDMATQVAFHDVNHSDQIGRALGHAERFVVE